MPPYRGPEKEVPHFESKFVRVGDDIYVDEHGDIFIEHRAIAFKDSVLGELTRLRRQDPTAVDAGFVTIAHGETGNNRITINGESFGLHLPEVGEARAKTGILFQQKSPGFEVTLLSYQLPY